MLAATSGHDTNFAGRSSGQPTPGADAMVTETVVEQVLHGLRASANGAPNVTGTGANVPHQTVRCGAKRRPTRLN